MSTTIWMQKKTIAIILHFVYTILYTRIYISSKDDQIILWPSPLYWPLSSYYKRIFVYIFTGQMFNGKFIPLSGGGWGGLTLLGYVQMCHHFGVLFHTCKYKYDFFYSLVYCISGNNSWDLNIAYIAHFIFALY